MEPIMTSILVGSGLSAVGQALGQRNTDHNREQDFANWNLARQANFSDSQRAQINAPMNTKLGMMYAGLDPSSGAPSPATPAASPMQSTKTDPLPLAQSASLVADAKLKEQQAESVKLENDITKGQNEGADSNYKAFGASLVSTLRENGFAAAADSLESDIDNVMKNGQINVGHLRGAIESFKTFDAYQERLEQTLRKIILAKDAQYQLKNDSAKQMARMPTLQAELTSKYVSTQIALAEYYMTSADVNEGRVKEIQKNIQKMDGEINLMVKQGKLSQAQADSIRNSDWKSLLYDGEVTKASIAAGEKLGGELLEQGTKVAQELIRMKGLKNLPNMVSGSQIMPPTFRSSPSSPSTLKTSTPRASKFDSHVEPEKYDYEKLYKRDLNDRKYVNKKHKKFSDIVDSPEFSNPDW